MVDELEVDEVGLDELVVDEVKNRPSGCRRGARLPDAPPIYTALSTLPEDRLKPSTVYTERQKKLITSSGRRSLKSTLSKWIFRHNKNIWKKKKNSCVKKEKNAGKSRKVIFSKIEETAHRASSERATQRYTKFRTFDSYSLNFNGGLRKRRTAFCLHASNS